MKNDKLKIQKLQRICRLESSRVRHWRAKALAYMEVIEKAHNALAQNLPEQACNYLRDAYNF